MLVVNAEFDAIVVIDMRVIMQRVVNIDKTKNQDYYKRYENKFPHSVTICRNHVDAAEGVMVAGLFPS